MKNSFFSIVCFTSLSLVPLNVTAKEKKALPKQGNEISSESAKQKIHGQEGIHLKRIIEFWKDEDYSAAKNQILSFLNIYKESTAKEQLLAMLGDLYVQEKAYREALSAYLQIQNSRIQEKVALNEAQCLFELQDYASVIKLSEQYAKSGKKDDPAQLRFSFLAAQSLFKQMKTASDEQKKFSYGKEAAHCFEQLVDSSYGETALVCLADIYQELKEDDKAIKTYRTLTVKYPEKREALLFQIARLQLEHDPLGAAETLGKIVELKEKGAPLAAFDQLLLFFQTQHFDELINTYRLSSSLLPLEKKDSIDFMVGRSYFALGNYEEAVNTLKNLVSKGDQHSPHLKSSILILLSCAEQEKNLALFDFALDKLLNTYPNDPEAAKALVLHAELAAANKDSKTALKDLEKVMAAFPDYRHNESFIYDQALLQFQEKDFAHARQTLLNFIELFPTSTKLADAARMLFNCSLHELKNASNDSLEEKKRQFAHDLTFLLSQKGALSELENQENQLVLIKTLFELGDHQASVSLLKEYLKRDLPVEAKAEAQNLLAFCYEKNEPHSESFIAEAEKAIQLDPKKADALHIPLYNAYLSLSKTDNVQKANDHLEKAASHLFSAFDQGEQPIKIENLLWLANYYYQNAQNNTEALKRAEIIYENFFEIEDDKWSFEFTEENLVLESEALKLAELYALKNQRNTQIAILKGLTEQQQTHPTLPWSYQRRALFELGRAYEQADDVKNALQTYERLAASSELVNSYFSDAALLQHSKLLFTQLSVSEKNENNPHIQEILQSLKDLQIKKKLSTEPLHLEAALQYAEVRASLCPLAQQKEKKLFFLKRLLEDYSSQSSSSRYYHAASEHFPEQYLIFQNYISFVEAEICRLESDLLEANQEKEQANVLKKKAKIAVDELMQKKDMLPPSLFDKVQRSQEALQRA